MRVRVDITFPTARLAIFVDGCFWHRCPLHGVEPSVNQQYWPPKLQRNVDRDSRVNDSLVAAGWTVVRVWETDVKRDPEAAAARIARKLSDPPLDGGAS